MAQGYDNGLGFESWQNNPSITGGGDGLGGMLFAYAADQTGLKDYLNNLKSPSVSQDDPNAEANRRLAIHNSGLDSAAIPPQISGGVNPISPLGAGPSIPQSISNYTFSSPVANQNLGGWQNTQQQFPNGHAILNGQ